jgi:branched-chain amino acid transport system ATP-binding protein
VSAVLTVSALTKSFGEFRAVDHVDLSVADGEIRAVIGPNGAGKTTLFNLVTGHLRPTAGTVSFAGRDLTGRPPHVVARAGLARAFQVTNVFPRLSVLECMQYAVLAHQRRTNDFWTFRHRSTAAEARQVLGDVGLAHLATAEARTLSHGDQRALEVALALATRPRLLLLDEPTAGMSPWETERTVALVRRLANETGLTVLFCEHDVDMVFSVADRITVMHQGQVIAEGPPAQVRADEQVNRVYLGEGV